MKHLNLIFILIIVFTACEPKAIDIDVPPAETKLVISSQIIPNRVMIVSVTGSFSALENKHEKDSLSKGFLDSIFVSNALVTVSYFGQTDTLNMISPGLYASVNTLQYNYGTYNLYTKDPATGLEVTASTTLLPQVRFDSVYPSIIKTPIDSVVNLYYELSDNLNTVNYYVVNYVRKLNAGNSSLDINQVFSNGNNSFQTYFDLLNDDSFNKGKLAMNKKLEHVTPHDSIAVMVSNISKSYYDFLSAYKRSGSFFNQLTGEPINYPSNINNGYGYFNAHYPTIRYFDLKNY